MKSYKPVLLCGWLADFIFNISALVGRPLYFYHDGIMYMVSVMFFSTSSSHFVNFAGVMIWIYGFMQLMGLPAFQFLTRYLMVIWNVQLKACTVLLMLLLWNLVPISYTVLVYFTCSGDSSYQKTALSVFGKDVMTTMRDNHTLETRFVMTCDTNSTLMLVLCGYAFLQIAVTYGLILFCGWKIYTNLQMATSSKPKMQHVQKQITNILLVQAITPPLMGGLPLVYIFVMAIMKVDSSPMLVEIFDRVLAIVPIVNPMLAIYFVKPYRTVITDAIGCSSNTDNQVSPVTEDNFHVSQIIA